MDRDDQGCKGQSEDHSRDRVTKLHGVPIALFAASIISTSFAAPASIRRWSQLEIEDEKF